MIANKANMTFTSLIPRKCLLPITLNLYTYRQDFTEYICILYICMYKNEIHV